MSDRRGGDRGERRWRPPGAARARILMCGLVLAVLGVATVVALLDSPSTATKEWVSNVATVLLAAAVALTSGWAAGRASGRVRWGWWLMALAGALWTVGEILWLVEAYLLESEAVPAWSDAFYLLALVPAAGALLVFPPPPPDRSEAVRVALTGLVVVGAVFFVSRTLALSVILPNVTGSWSARAVLIAYPVADVVLASLALVVVARSGSRPRMHFVVLAVGFLAYSVADTVYVRAEALDSYTVGGLLDLGWVVGYALFALAPLWTPPTPISKTSPGSIRSGARLDRRPRRPATARQLDFSSLALYLPLLAAVVVAAAAPPLTPDLVLILTALVTLGAFALRQALLAGDDQRLRADLELQVSQLRARSGELTQLASQNQRVLESVVDGVLGVDAAGLVTFANPQAVGLLGRSSAELVGTHETLLFADPGDDEDPGARVEVGDRGSDISRALVGGTMVTGARTRFRRGDGPPLSVELAVGPIRQAGEIVGAVVVFHDISGRLAVEKMRNEFISVVSHELRTPLTSIRGSLGMLEAGHGGELTAAGARMVSIALGSSERLSRLIEDMLDIERMESGTLTMVPVLCDFRPLVVTALHEVDAMTRQYAVQIELRDVEATVVGDADRIVQALTNLVGNAIKFSPRGGTVLLTVEQRGRMVVISVTDQGRGIPPSRLERIFERFEQVDSSDARERGGTGLGLSISRDIIALHGGRLWVESVLGEGSTFRFTLPGAVGSVTQPPAPAVPASGGPVRTGPLVMG